MSESYFAQITNDVLAAAEKLTDRFVEGINILLGVISPSSRESATKSATPSQNEFEGWDEDVHGGGDISEDILNESSPLAGIADSVMGDIMAGQVRAGSCHE